MKDFLKCVCVLVALGFASSTKLDRNQFNAMTIHKPLINSTARSAQTFWDPDFCNDYEDLDAFPHPDSCWQYLICWFGELYEDECPHGEMFDRWNGYCDDEANVVCADDENPNYPDPDEMCPPANSNEIRFLPSEYCDEYFICLNGQPVLLYCRPGQHWNIEKEFCDDPKTAGCDVS